MRALEVLRLGTIAVVAAVSLGGCTAMLLGNPDGSPAPVAGEDRRLADAVRNAFGTAQLAERNTIAVTARDGVVTLGGRVSMPEVRQQAEQIARGVPGVRRVVNSIQ